MCKLGPENFFMPENKSSLFQKLIDPCFKKKKKNKLRDIVKSFLGNKVENYQMSKM